MTYLLNLTLVTAIMFAFKVTGASLIAILKNTVHNHAVFAIPAYSGCFLVPMLAPS